MKHCYAKNIPKRLNKNEIDIVAINDVEKSLLIAEAKRQPQNINMNKLKQKAEKLVTRFADYKIKYKGYSLQDLMMNDS